MKDANLKRPNYNDKKKISGCQRLERRRTRQGFSREVKLLYDSVMVDTGYYAFVKTP
jgi:hypothetical protein